MHILIVDDENRSALLLQSMLLNVIDPCETIAIANNFKDALNYIKTQEITLLFIDAEINGKSAFDLLDCIPYSQFKIIFTAASKEDAFKAFEYGALGYLLKPINPLDLKNCINRIV